jgi:uncharacterized repeat protein (TIGR01451 family)
LTAGAFAEHTTLIVCPADISITKTADELSKVGDDVTYTFVLTNEGDATANRVSVNDTLLGDITASFPATLAAGASATVTRHHRRHADGRSARRREHRGHFQRLHCGPRDWRQLHDRHGADGVGHRSQPALNTVTVHYTRTGSPTTSPTRLRRAWP